MVRVPLEMLLLSLIALPVACDDQPNPNATPCERDCINDSGGKGWCADYCKKHGTYGPAKQ